jgi:predicted amidohydrolase
MGPISRNDSRSAVVDRLVDLMGQAHDLGCDLVVFPELALTTFFPKIYMTEWNDVDAFFEKEMPSPETQRLFERAADWGIGFYLGYAELTQEDGEVRRYNSSILVDRAGTVVGKYRKVHIPGYEDLNPDRPVQQLERRYFNLGNLGYQVWEAFGGVMGMCICYDRRWPETYRVMGLQGVEMVLLGYNTPAINVSGDEPVHRRMFHNHLSMQAGAYQNATYVVATAKSGVEDGVHLIGGSCIIAPWGEIIALAQTEGDEVICADCDLDHCRFGRETIFNLAKYRRPDCYGPICQEDWVIPRRDP